MKVKTESVQINPEDIVKYNNRLNGIRLSNFLPMDLDMLMLLAARMKEHKTEKLVFTFAELKKSLSISNKSDSDFLEVLGRMNAKLNGITCNIKTDTKRISFVLFQTLIADSETRTLTVSVNQDFSYLLNEWSDGFTKFELQEFVKLESRYSKSLYRLLKQFRDTGIYEISADRIRELMDCPKGYPNREFVRVCVNPAVKELSSCFDGLKVEPIRGAGRGRPIEKYVFTFKPDEKEKKEPAKSPKSKKPQPKPNRFNNFTQREYDFDELERMILNEQH